MICCKWTIKKVSKQTNNKTSVCNGAFHLRMNQNELIYFEYFKLETIKRNVGFVVIRYAAEIRLYAVRRVKMKNYTVRKGMSGFTLIKTNKYK